jgi:Phage tail sheath protein subtilisin-like domain/Phage tail sheath C-terminal domain
MATLRQIQSPGVQINEIDLSQTTSVPNGTNVFITGFASQGPANEIINLTTGNDFTNIFGTPTNAAERYFYYSVQQQFNAGTNAQVSVYRLPYGGGMGDGYASNKYSALVFPILPALTPGTTTAAAASTITAFASASTYYLAAPQLIELTQDNYTTLKQNGVNWSTTGGGTAPVINNVGDLSGNGVGLVILNESQTTVNEKFEGLYLNLADNTGLSPTSNYTEVQNIYSITADQPSYGVTGTYTYTPIPTNRLSFQLSAAYTDPTPSISHVIENIPQYDISNIGNGGFDDLAIVSLVKVRTSPFGNNPLQLTYSLQEGYATSFYANRTIQNVNGGAPKSDFIETVINNASPNLTVFVNPNIANNTKWIDLSGNAAKQVRVLTTVNQTGNYKAANSLFPLGVYAPSLDTTNVKVIGDVGAKVDNALSLAANADVYNIDVIADAGLSTIAAIAQTGIYDDTVYNAAVQGAVDGLTQSDGNYTPDSIISTWSQITQKFIDFTTYQRKDCIFISDPLRQIFVQGADFKTLKDPAASFSNNIYWPLRNTYQGVNTSYATAYGQWVKIIDSFTSKPSWLPFSGFAAAIYTSNDAIAYPWAAPAGANRGTVTGIADIAINPNQKQRDLLYKISVNPVVNFPGAGFSIQGQKTLLQTPSAFDRINVRRLFLFLEKSVLRTSKSFLFEPNTTFTRNRLTNTIKPVFDLAKNTQGVYDFLIVCNDTNNTPNVIDDNSLVVDIYIKPVRTAEFILVNFYCTKTSQNFQELLQ